MPNEETLTEKFEGHTPGPLITDEEGGLLVVGDKATGACLTEIHLDGDVPANVARVNGELYAKAPVLLRERDALRADLAIQYRALREHIEALASARAEADEARRQRDALADLLRDLASYAHIVADGGGTLGTLRRLANESRAALAKAGRQ